ncbi:MAG: NAD(P)-dependent oxidoreductase [Thermoleophilia bacterium]|nr:NAD(P)-dependent oxidoreductase [Thermoleophilia bacterium]
MASVGVLHPGEMGAAVAAVARGDVWWAPEGRSEATAARARDAGLRPAPLPELLGRCDVLISICPPHAALDVAAACAGYRGVYCDANAISPDSMSRVAGLVAGDVVDGGIVGGPPRMPGTRFYLSGGAAGEIGALFAGTVLEPVVIGDEIGAASALKLCYAAWTKGSAALLLTVAEAAERLGLGEALRAEWERSQPGLAEQLASAARAADAKGWRWVAEMREIESTLLAAGLPGGYHGAAAETFEQR